MIRIKTLKSSTPLLSGSTSLADKDAEMLLDHGTGTIYIRRRGKLPAGVPKVFIVHLSRVERVEVFEEQIDEVFEGEPSVVFTPEQLQALERGEKVVTEAKLITTTPGFTAQVQMPPVEDGVERAIKINGKVEFRRGPMKPDEIEALVQAKKDRVEALMQISEAEWTTEQRKMVEEYTASNPPDAVPTPPAAPSKPTSIAEMLKAK